MSGGTSEQELLIQLETALHRLVESFWEEPYRYFTESDAVTSLWQWFAQRPGLVEPYRTADEAYRFETGLLHREYPTFFRLDDRDPKERKGRPFRRGHYDLVLLSPGFIQSNDAESVTNRRIKERPEHSVPPLVAAVEFKLSVREFRPERETTIRHDLGKLKLALESPPDIGAAYMCVLWRDEKASPDNLEEYRDVVEKLLLEYPSIGFVLAASWPQHQSQSFVHYGGPWLTAETDSPK